MLQMFAFNFVLKFRELTRTAPMPRRAMSAESEANNKVINTVHMYSGKMLNRAGVLKLVGGGLEGTSFPPNDPQISI